MLVLKRRQAVALILLSVLVAADPDQCGFQQPHNCGQDFLSWQAFECQVIADLFTDSRQALSESQHMMIFRALAHLSEARVISILFASLCIAPGCLDVPVRSRADPDVSPSWRNGKGLNALKGDIINFAPAGCRVAKAGTASPAADSRLLVADIGKARILSGIFGVDDRFGGRHIQHRTTRGAYSRLVLVNGTGGATVPLQGPYQPDGRIRKINGMAATSSSLTGRRPARGRIYGGNPSCPAGKSAEPRDA